MTANEPIRFKFWYKLFLWIPYLVLIAIIGVSVLIAYTDTAFFMGKNDNQIGLPFYICLASLSCLWLFSDYLRDEICKGKRLTGKFILAFIGASISYGILYLHQNVDLAMIARLVPPESSILIKVYDVLLTYLVRILFACNILSFGLYLYSERQKDQSVSEESC